MPESDTRAPAPPQGTGAAIPPVRKLFLERRVYQRRRLIDAAKLLPLAGLVLFLAPALLLGTPGGQGEGGSTALRLIYFLFVWAVLIAVCAVIGRGLGEEGGPNADTPTVSDP